MLLHLIYKIHRENKFWQNIFHTFFLHCKFQGECRKYHTRGHADIYKLHRPIKFAKLGNICDMPATLPAFRAIKAHFIFDFLVRKFRQIVLTPLVVNLALVRLFRLKVVYRAQF